MSRIISKLLGFTLTILSLSAMAQTNSGSATVTLTLSEIALLDIEPNNSPISIAITPPLEAGNPISTSTLTNAKWLNYTSAVPTSNSRNIIAQISSGILPTGTDLTLNTSAFSGSAWRAVSESQLSAERLGTKK